MIPAFRKIFTGDDRLERIQDSVKQVFDAIRAIRMVNGHFIPGVVLSNATTQVSHGLGRRYLSWFAGNFSGPARLHTGVSIDPSLYVAIVSDAGVTCDLWVF